MPYTLNLTRNLRHIQAHSIFHIIFNIAQAMLEYALSTYLISLKEYISLW
ncbi:hypothetical protein [Helicobacter cinaedi]|uniref:Uncharacterized protein n=1 Tax=Helicobacter cinaedi CCUG 18818 = ATCC BAA-847 TaxID=537971 RepID=A0ABN0BAP5_9HELI|nr:hypothetical protein [Helicobacter cinaedi]EFR46636.1 hypothetical protein HCCG_01183 [Helicobacter cinaedi CCUG 18818 = ATCC BAA-847]QOQ97282.1 hypothetical protein HW245_10610 [Helicobacter cinaedi]